MDDASVPLVDDETLELASLVARSRGETLSDFVQRVVLTAICADSSTAAYVSPKARAATFEAVRIGLQEFARLYGQVEPKS